MGQRWCSVADCTELAWRGEFCRTHYRWVQEGKALTDEKQVHKRGMHPLDRLNEAAITYANADGDEEWARARDNLRKSAVKYAHSLQAERARSALERLRRRGLRVGRRPKVDRETVERVLAELGGSITATARRLGVTRPTVYLALRKGSRRSFTPPEQRHS